VAMPRGVGVERPALLLPFDDVGWHALPSHRRHVLHKRRVPDRHDVGYERIEEPLLLSAATGAHVVTAELPQLLAHLDAKLDTTVPQRFARPALVHLGVDVERREQRIEGRGRGVDEERLVEPPRLDIAPLSAYVVVPLVDLRGLREPRTLLVDRLGGEK